MISSIIFYATSVMVSFLATFLKGFQQKNVIGNHKITMFYTSYLIAAFEFASISLIIKGHWPMILSTGTGAGLGMLFAVRAHTKLFGKKNEKHIRS